jgi:hypothetical protein
VYRQVLSFPIAVLNQRLYVNFLATMFHPCLNVSHFLPVDLDVSCMKLKLKHPVFFFPEGGAGLVPKRGCLLTLAYYAFPR